MRHVFTTDFTGAEICTMVCIAVVKLDFVNLMCLKVQYNDSNLTCKTTACIFGSHFN